MQLSLKRSFELFRKALHRAPVISGILPWVTDPLHISHLLLHQVVKNQANYARGRMLDVGCGNKPYRDLFKNIDEYIGLDYRYGEKADLWGDGQTLAFRDRTFDTVLCTEVLEHVPEPSRLMAECARVLKPSGFLLLTTPQTWGLHMEPYDFYRYTKYGLRYLTEKSGLKVVEITPTCGLWATLAQRFADTVVYNYAVGQSSVMIRFLSILLAPVLVAGYGLDWLFGKRGDTLDNSLVAVK